MTHWAKRLIALLHTIEDGMIVSMLTAMTLLAVGQIVLRNFFETSISWGDPLIRVMVLWVALLGAMAATRADNHIKIDLFSRFLAPHWLRWSNRLTHSFAAGICATLSWHAGRFVLFEKEDAFILFSSVPAWLCELIIPIGFAVMALRFALLCILPPEPRP